MKIVTTALILAAVAIICCTAMPKKRFCSRKPKTGPCRGAFERYFYNTTSERCETFTYGGCDGNKNRFTSYLSCMQTCHKCPIKGQIIYRCAPCDGTCDRPLVPCPRICRAGCACPRGEVIKPARKKCVPLHKCPPRCKYNGQYYKPGQTFNSTDGCNICTCSKNGNVSCTERACIPESCPVPGQVYSNCSSPCTFTCANIDRLSCIALCVKGCGCPGGQVIDEDKNKCVPISECPGREPECPIEGQIYYGDRCAPCDGTCDRPLVPCPLICRRGCGCPRGQVIDPARNRCVALSECPPRCPIQGQRYFNASKGECVPCTGTCEDTNPVCTRECRSGCGCPNGTVLDEGNNRCIHPRTCPRECEYEGEVYQPGDRWDCSDSGKCMKCWCLANGVVANHTIGCPKPMCVLKNGTKVPDGTYYRSLRNPCEHCYCINGTFRCAVQGCPRPPCRNPYRLPGVCCRICPPPGCRYNGQFYKPGAIFNSSDGCNTCTCSLLDSTVSCTELACRPKMICPRPLGPGVCAELCSSDDDCELDERCCSNGCGHQCTKGLRCAAFLCLRPSCPLNNIIPPGPDECCATCGCRYGGKTYRLGQTFSTIDGCNNCTCSTGGRTLCTKKDCNIPKCPIEGQIYYGGRHCAPCDGTCDRPLVPCPRICRSGCACPRGEVIDRAQNRCVVLSECSPLKPVCPKPTGPGTCVERCSRDKDCFAGQKCCSNGCGHVCTTIQNCAVILCAVPKCDFPTGVVIAPPAGWCCPGCGCSIGGGKVVRIGQSYRSGCNGCSCTMSGPICTLIACPPAPPGSK